MSPLQEESGCDEDEGEDEEEGREEEDGFDSDESLVDSDSDSEEKGVFLTHNKVTRSLPLSFHAFSLCHLVGHNWVKLTYLLYI